jgi:hypothetical protein
LAGAPLNGASFHFLATLADQRLKDGNSLLLLSVVTHQGAFAIPGLMQTTLWVASGLLARRYIHHYLAADS